VDPLEAQGLQRGEDVAVSAFPRVRSLKRSSRSTAVRSAGRRPSERKRSSRHLTRQSRIVASPRRNWPRGEFAVAYSCDRSPCSAPCVPPRSPAPPRGGCVPGSAARCPRPWRSSACASRSFWHSARLAVNWILKRSWPSGCGARLGGRVAEAGEIGAAGSGVVARESAARAGSAAGRDEPESLGASGAPAVGLLCGSLRTSAAASGFGARSASNASIARLLRCRARSSSSTWFSAVR
jgi:hypothetical protein